MKQHKKKKEFNDLLVPIILVLAVLPFVVRLISYHTGLSDYSWYSDFDIAQDFFSYYRSYMFLIIAFISLILLIVYLLLLKEYRKDMKAFLALGVYAFFAILSTVLSINIKSSLMGGFEHFETIFVLLGYLIMLVYTYQIRKREEDYKVILRAFVISMIILGVIGLFQMFGIDLFMNEAVQKLIIPQSDWKDYVGNIKSHLSNNAVALTLFNPNYASVYLAMVIPFMLTLILPDSKNSAEKNYSKGTEKNAMVLNKTERSIIAAILVIFTILLYKTYSRTGLLSLVVSLLVLVILHRSFIISKWKQCIIIGICACLLFVGIDYMNGLRFTNKLIGTVQSFYDEDKVAYDEILTKKEGVTFDIDGEQITVSYTEDTEDGAVLEFVNAEGADITDRYDSNARHLSYNQFEKATFYIKNTDGKNSIISELNGVTWRFYQDEKFGYYYVNDFDKSVQLIKTDHLGWKGIEDVGSGRGYIWSRSIPLVMNSLLTGTGPDTFLYAFPQSDYVGKANNCKTPVTLIEKPHSFYLMMAIQTGVISLIAFLVFYFIYLVQSIRIYRKLELTGLKERMGLGCFLATVSFMISGFFNDSSIQTTPIFIILLGLGMDINYLLNPSRKAVIRK